MPNIYQLIAPKGKPVPILVSVPHCGTAFPEELISGYRKEMVSNPDDTDFFVQDVYDFVTEMGITLIQAHYSRWVIDLNRSPQNKSLYTDGRLITGLTPTTDFLGNKLYVSAEYEPSQEEVNRRKKLYYQPYYDKITEILTGFKQDFGQAILWDAHSIRRVVPTIHPTPFPSFILGTNDGKTAAPTLIAAAKKGIAAHQVEMTYNHPFKGGNITRHFGDPSNNIHALQLEMIKTLYMDDGELVYHPSRAKKLRSRLKYTFELLIETLRKSRNRITY